MLTYNIRGTNFEATPAINNYVESKLQKLERFFTSEINTIAAVNLKTLNNSEFRAEVTIPMKNITLRAEQQHTDIYAAIDLILDKLERQIRKYKTKVNRKSRQRKGAGIDFAEEMNTIQNEEIEAIEEQEHYTIIRKKQFDLKPMSTEEAVLQMDLLGHDFFVFRDAETDETNVVYKRKEGDYALIETK